MKQLHGWAFGSIGMLGMAQLAMAEDPFLDQLDSDRVQSIASALASRESAWAAGNIAAPVPRAVAQ